MVLCSFKLREFTMNKKNSALATTLLLLPMSAHAYLDPGTGSLIAQALIGAIAGSFMFCKLYWSKIKTFFSKDKNKEIE